MSAPALAFGALTLEVTRLHGKRFEAYAQQVGLSLKDCRILLAISREQGLTQRLLATLAECEPMTIARTLNRMQASGWVQRHNNPRDRRTNRIYLGPDGPIALEEIGRVLRVTQQEAMQGLSSRHIRRLLQILSRARANLLALPPIVGALPQMESSSKGRPRIAT